MKNYRIDKQKRTTSNFLNELGEVVCFMSNDFTEKLYKVVGISNPRWKKIEGGFNGSDDEYGVYWIKEHIVSYIEI